MLLTIFISVDVRSPGTSLALAALLVALGLAVLTGLRRVAGVRSAATLVERLAGATAQIRIRGSFALLLIFTALAEWLGLEVVLGAFLAGAIISALSVAREHPLFQVKIDAIGYGFFVLVFFIITGARLDVPLLLATAEAQALVSILLLAVFVVKVPAAWLYRRYSTRKRLSANALLSAQLTLTVAGVEIDKPLGSALIIVALLQRADRSGRVRTPLPRSRERSIKIRQSV